MKKREILFVDGYNMIGAWSELNRLMRQGDTQEARDRLLFELSNYGKYRNWQVIVVFDAQHVPGVTTSFDYANLQVVFTESGETADTYIEREVGQYIRAWNRVMVATSDMAEQWLIFQKGALRQSAQELWIDIQHAKQQIQEDIRTHYDAMIRRYSPWQVEQLEQLDRLRYDLNQ